MDPGWEWVEGSDPGMVFVLNVQKCESARTHSRNGLDETMLSQEVVHVKPYLLTRNSSVRTSEKDPRRRATRESLDDIFTDGKGHTTRDVVSMDIL